MDIEKIKELFLKSTNKIKEIGSSSFSTSSYTSERYRKDNIPWEKLEPQKKAEVSVNLIEGLKRFIKTKTSELQEVLDVIEQFQSISSKYLKEEKDLIDYIDKDGGLAGEKIKKQISEALETLAFLKEKTLKTKIDSLSNKEIRNIQSLASKTKLFDYEYKIFGRIKKFLKGVLNEELAWRNGLIIKLNTYHHTKSVLKLSTQLNNWLKILKAFGRLNNDYESEYEIYELKKGSLLLTVTTIAGVVITLGKAINYVLDAVKKSYEIKKHIIELKKLQYEEIEGIAKELETVAIIDKEKESDSLSNRLIIEFKYEKDDKHEVQTALKKAIGYLLNFFDEGGETKLLMTPDLEEGVLKLKNDVDSKQIALLEGRKELKKLLSKENIKLIE